MFFARTSSRTSLRRATSRRTKSRYAERRRRLRLAVFYRTHFTSSQWEAERAWVPNRLATISQCERAKTVTNVISSTMENWFHFFSCSSGSSFIRASWSCEFDGDFRQLDGAVGTSRQDIGLSFSCTFFVKSWLCCQLHGSRKRKQRDHRQPYWRNELFNLHASTNVAGSRRTGPRLRHHSEEKLVNKLFFFSLFEWLLFSCWGSAWAAGNVRWAV